MRNCPPVIRLAALAATLSASAIGTSPAGQPLHLRLPTGNTHLFSGEPEKFYMYVDRTFEGERSTPWQGGQYGFVRNPTRNGDELIYTRFHEGIDIAPIKRDRAGNPLDLVNSIGPGTVVHVNPTSSHSNYGKYVVVRHDFPGGPFFSLYAHLGETGCRPGERVRAGGLLGRMGYTGRGLNRTRAHLHLEFGLLLHSRFEDWHASHAGGTNYHGIHNGMNIAGMDIARLFLEHRRNPNISIPAFIQSTPIHFKVLVPRDGSLEIARRHPWLLAGSSATSSPSWEISFSATGLPMAVAPNPRKVTEPTVSYAKPATTPHWMVTRSLLNGSGSSPYLGRSGKSLLALLIGDFPPAPQRKPPAS